MAARCSWTKSATCRLTCRPACCGCLSDGNFYRVGGHDAVKTNVRVIAATHQDLEQRVKEGAFREDLFHRLNVIRLRLPPLRERREDIAGLTRHFLQQSAQAARRRAQAHLGRRRSSAWRDFAFPGNVRQLENICHWLTVMAPAQVIEAKDLPPEVLASRRGASVRRRGRNRPQPGRRSRRRPRQPSAVPSDAADVWLPARRVAPERPCAGCAAESSRTGSPACRREADQMLAAGRPDVWDVLTRRFESRLIQTALASTHGRRIEAAQKLGIGRNTITRKIQDLGLE